jgi:monofunctional biosynthetic peptidoglycan transglycosylase
VKRVAENLVRILDFADPEWPERWYPINDGVMGGASSGALVPSDQGTALFAGCVSLENNGGFASVRCRPQAFDISPFEALALWVRGDGKRYKLNIRLDDFQDGIQYQAGFVAPADEWTLVRLPLLGFEATFRGRKLGAGPFDPARVRTLGLMISDRQAGPFRLEIAWIAGSPA